MNLARLRSVLSRTPGATQTGPIGFDLGHDKLHALQLEREEETLGVRAAACVSLPAGCRSDARTGLRPLVARTLKDRGFEGRRIVAAMPADDLKLMVLNYELSRQQTEPELIISRVEERIQEPVDGWVVDYLAIRKNPDEKGEHSALVAMAREDAVIQHLELLRSAGLEVEALEIGPVAVRRLITWLDNVLVINCGQEKSYLMVLWGQRLILYREIDFGEQQVIERVSKSLDMGSESAASLLYEFGVFPEADPPADAGANAREIRQTLMEILKSSFNTVAEHVANALVYTASRTRGESVDSVYLLGPMARWPGADSLLGALVSIPVQILDPLAGLESIRDGLGLSDMKCSLGFTLAAGLALRGMESRG